jgi:hypothetical protein
MAAAVRVDLNQPCLDFAPLRTVQRLNTYAHPISLRELRDHVNEVRLRPEFSQGQRSLSRIGPLPGGR